VDIIRLYHTFNMIIYETVHSCLINTHVDSMASSTDFSRNNENIKINTQWNTKQCLHISLHIHVHSSIWNTQCLKSAKLYNHTVIIIAQNIKCVD